MVFGAILAGGSGTRMKNSLVPKQFIELCKTPIIAITINAMLTVDEFEKIYIAIHPDYRDMLSEILNKHKINTNRIKIISGGKERLDSIKNVIATIESDSPDIENNCVVIHDAVRPFVSKKILEDSIAAVKEHGACVAAVPAIDTMLTVEDGNFVKSVPNRKNMFCGQAPDSFNVKLLKDAINSLTPEEAACITGTAQICVVKSIPVKIIEGDYKNIKITTNIDLLIAEQLCE